MKYCLAILVMWCNIQYALSQGFNIPDDVCPGAATTFTSPQPSAYRQEWDFCTGDLAFAPNNSVLINNGFIPFSFAPEGMELVYDDKLTPSKADDEWYGFISNRQGTSLVRMDFGSDLSNSPSYTQVPIGITNCYEMQFVRENGNWYALSVRNIGSPVRLDFGNSLTNNPQLVMLPEPAPAEPLFSNGSQFSLKVRKQGDHYIGLFLNTLTQFMNINDTRLVMVNFGTSITNPITLSNVIATPNVGFNSPGFTDSNPGFDVIKDGDNWYVLTCGRNNLRLLRFGNNLYSQPSITDITPNVLGLNPNDTYTRLRLVREGKNFYAFMIALSGNIVRLNFGQTMDNNAPIHTNFGNFGLIGTQQQANRPSFTLAIAQHQSNWHLFAISRLVSFNNPSQPSRLVRLDFPNSCNLSPTTSTDTQPQVIFRQFGKVYPNLRTVGSDNVPDTYYIDSLNITPATLGDFALANFCVGDPLQIANLSQGDDANVGSWNWDFGDGTTSTAKQPAKTYNTPGRYLVKLTVNNVSGCVNTTQKSIRISARPRAYFEVINLDCASGTITLKDLSSLSAADMMNGGRIATRLWDFGDGRQYIAAPDTITFVRKGNAPENPIAGLTMADNMPYTSNQRYTITLTIIDETGCASSFSREISLRPQDAPVADFSVPNACAQVPLGFTNTSQLPSGVSGRIVGQTWTFFDTDGTTVRAISTLAAPSFTYPQAGTYPVRLTVRNTQGCSATITKNITVNASLNTQFAASATFGVAPLTVQFTSQTPNAQSYLWNFGDGRISTQASPLITFTRPGAYDISFQARNAAGCGTIATMRLTVDETPTATDDPFGAGLRIFPNPSTTHLEVAWQAPWQAGDMLALLDMRGTRVHQQPLPNGLDRLTLALADLPAGVYVLDLTIGGKRARRRVIKL